LDRAAWRDMVGDLCPLGIKCEKERTLGGIWLQAYVSLGIKCEKGRIALDSKTWMYIILEICSSLGLEVER
jgi:hypothetical protein